MNRIQYFREKAGLTQAQLAERIGTTQPQIFRLETAKRKLSIEWAEKIAPHLGTTAQELMFADPVTPSPIDDGLPVVGTTEAGNWRDSSLASPRKDLPDTIPVAPDSRYRHACQYALLVNGDSMDKIISDGSFVTCAAFADTGLEYRAGMILHVERHQGPLVETTIKRYAEINGKRFLLPESNNPSHKPIEINGGEDTEIFVKGLVLGTWTPISY